MGRVVVSREGVRRRGRRATGGGRRATKRRDDDGRRRTTHHPRRTTRDARRATAKRGGRGGTPSLAAPCPRAPPVGDAWRRAESGERRAEDVRTARWARGCDGARGRDGVASAANEHAATARARRDRRGDLPGHGARCARSLQGRRSRGLREGPDGERPRHRPRRRLDVLQGRARTQPEGEELLRRARLRLDEPLRWLLRHLREDPGARPSAPPS